MSSDIASLDLAGAIDVIEETYEYMLAYAAQGRTDDTDTSSASIRAYLERSDLALGVIAAARIPDAAAQNFWMSCGRTRPRRAPPSAWCCPDPP